MADLNKLTMADARDKLRGKEITSVELTEACLNAVDGAKTLNAFVHNTPDLALEQAKAADAMLDRIGLNHVADQYPASLSGGMQQRLAIGQAMAAKPRLLFCRRYLPMLNFLV